MLQRSTASKFHALWGIDINLLDATWFEHTRVHRQKQLTDVYLRGIAVKSKGRTVMFGKRIALNAVHGASAAHVVVFLLQGWFS